MPPPLQMLNQRRMRNKLDAHASVFDPIGRGSRSKSKRRQASPFQLPARRTLMLSNEANRKCQWIHKRIRFILSCLREPVEYRCDLVLLALPVRLYIKSLRHGRVRSRNEHQSPPLPSDKGLRRNAHLLPLGYLFEFFSGAQFVLLSRGRKGRRYLPADRQIR